MARLTRLHGQSVQRRPQNFLAAQKKNVALLKGGKAFSIQRQRHVSAAMTKSMFENIGTGPAAAERTGTTTTKNVR
jgi:hypothetical protein